MNIKLDGKNNIIDNMYSDLPENNSTKKLSESEKEYIIEKVNKKVTYDYYNKPALKIKRGGDSDYVSISMQKARPTKYIKKIIVNGKPRYFYTQQQVKEYQDSLKRETEKKTGFNLFSAIKNLFGFGNEREASKKVQDDYKNNELDKKGVTWDDWKNHLSEYFKNKDKWDAFFGKEKGEKKPAEKKEKKEKGEKKEKKKTFVKLSLMKLIYNIYGNVQPPAQRPKDSVPSWVTEGVTESNFDTMPDSEYVQMAKNMPQGLFAEDDTANYYNMNGKVFTEYKSDIIEGVTGTFFRENVIPIPLVDFLRNNFGPEKENSFEMKESAKKKMSPTSKRGIEMQEAKNKIIENVMDFIERGMYTADEFLQGMDVTKHIDKDLGKYVSNPIVWNAVIAAVRKKYFPSEKDLSEQISKLEPEKRKEVRIIDSKTINLDDGAKIEINVKLNDAQKKEEIENEEIASREGYFNEKPAEILNVGKDVFGAARHNFTTYEKMDADIFTMEQDGTASAYVTKKNLFGDYGLENKDERVANGETEYKVLASFAIRQFLLKVPKDNPEARKKYVEFARAIVRADNDTKTAKEFIGGLSELYELSFPQRKDNLERERYGTNFVLHESLYKEYLAKDVIGESLKAFFDTLAYPGYKRSYYGLDKKGRKEFENLASIILSESGAEKSSKTYDQLRIDILGATKASGIKIKKGDTVLLSDEIKEKVYMVKSTVLDESGWENWKNELDSIYNNAEYLPDQGDSFTVSHTLQDSKGNIKKFKDKIEISRAEGAYIGYKIFGETYSSGTMSSRSFLKNILSGSTKIEKIQNPEKREKINEAVKRIEDLYNEESKYIRRDKIYPEKSGQVAKAGKTDVIVSFAYPDGRIRNIRFDPLEIKPESIENIKKSVNKKETFVPNLFVESKVLRTGGKDFSSLPTSEIQKTLENNVMAKSLQYGNSMPDDERRAHSRWTLESFSDLSDILGIPLQQISVNGKLGMAFGARGRAGALAHYESETKMINITRGKGFGSLAHEWGHFLDNILSKDMQTFITRTPEYRGSMKSFEEMNHGDIYLHESRRKKKPDKYFLDKNAKNPKYPFAKLEEGQVEPDANSSYVSFYFQNATAGGMPVKVEVQEAVENRISSQAMKIAKKSKEALHQNADASDPIIQKLIKNDKYLNDSAELFARSFECYVADKLEDNGRKNTYLSSKQKTILGDGAIVYPQGEIRKEINQMFDEFFNSLRNTNDLQKALIRSTGKTIFFRKV